MKTDLRKARSFFFLTFIAFAAFNMFNKLFSVLHSSYFPPTMQPEIPQDQYQLPITATYAPNQYHQRLPGAEQLTRQIPPK
jgi:hypothetical protein